MPELPEVETVRRGIARLVCHQQLRRVTVLAAKSWQVKASEQADLVGATLESVSRRGKLLIMQFSSGQALLCHLRMTGQLVWRGAENWGAGHPNESFVGELPDNSTRVILEFSQGTLYFNDQRKFGFMLVWPIAQLDEFPFVKKLGPEPFAAAALPEFIRRVRRHSKTTIKAAILNQSVVAGVGNIYADEGLYRAGIRPMTVVQAVDDAQLAKLYRAIAAVMRQSIAAGGSSMRNYVQADGSRGDYLDLFAQVFNRAGQPCRQCQTEIVKTRVAGRGTYYCPKCQS